MGFASPAADFVERRTPLEQRFQAHLSATYYIWAAVSYYSAGILSGALLDIDSSLKQCDGSLLICETEKKFAINQHRTLYSRSDDNVIHCILW